MDDKNFSPFLTLRRGPDDDVLVPRVRRGRGLAARFGDVGRYDRREGHVDRVVHRVVEPPPVLLRRPYRPRILLSQLGHRVRGDEGVLREVEDEADDLVLALAALLLAQDQRLQDLYFLRESVIGTERKNVEMGVERILMTSPCRY